MATSELHVQSGNKQLSDCFKYIKPKFRFLWSRGPLMDLIAGAPIGNRVK